eukprot:gene28914-35242_t
MSLAVAGKALWVVLIVAWYLLRRPFDRRARRAKLTVDRRKGADTLRPVLFTLGILTGIAALLLFRLTHKALGQMWSVSLQLKQDHKLITTGIYKRLRHPMYTAFWLMALTQALL